MKLSWTYLLQLVSVSLFLKAVAGAPVAEGAPDSIVERTTEARSVGGDYLWLIDDDEKARLSELLGFDFHATGVNGVRIDGPKQKCRGCGKYTGLDDIVHNALDGAIHSKEFMIKVLETRAPHLDDTPHEIRCSGAGCGMVHVEKRGWIGRWIEAVGDVPEAADALEDDSKA